MVRLADADARRLGEEPGVPWPVSAARLAAVTAAQRRALLARIEGPVGDPAVDALRRAAHHFAGDAGAVAEADTGLRLEGVAELEALRSDAAPEAAPTVASLAADDGTRRHLLRRAARVASWTPVARLPRALLAPGAVAVTHNALLCEAARDHAIGFRHADEWMTAILRGIG